MWLYVFGHELTHTIWTWIFGGRVKGFRISASGGYVETTRSNALIALAPYFFPIYVWLVILVTALLGIFLDTSHYAFWIHFAIGAAYAFHCTLTCHALSMEQTDITRSGRFLSFTIIATGNGAVLLAGIPLVTSQVGVTKALSWWVSDSVTAFCGIGNWAVGLVLVCLRHLRA